MRRILPLIAVLLTGCQATVTTAGPTSQTPSASVSASTTPGSPPLMVVTSSAGQGHYKISLVGEDGRTVASATAAYGDQKPVPFPGSAAGGQPSGMVDPSYELIAYRDEPLLPAAGICCDAMLPTISTSNTRVYFPDGPTTVRYLGRDGSSGIATSLPNPTAKTRAVFSVSPDDQRIAISVFDWSDVGPMYSILTVKDLNGGGHPVEVGRFFPLYGWPVGWHGGNVAVARIPAFGGAPNPNAAKAYSLINPSTREDLGCLGGMTCPVVGPLSHAGTACVGARCHCIMAVDWSGSENPTYVYADTTEMNWAALSPDGRAVIFTENYGANRGLGIWRDGSVKFTPNYGAQQMRWLDATHMVAGCPTGGGCYDITDLGNGTTAQVTLPGSIVGVLPGGL